MSGLTQVATESAAPNHRTRVGQERKEKTRALLIQSALKVFARKGPDLPVIDDFIAAAGVARGTFYNYFSTTAELLAAVAGEMSDEVLGVIDPEVLKFDDPVIRICMGTKRYIHIALRYPVWGEFLTRIGSQHAVRGKLLDVYLTRDIELAMAAGRCHIGSAAVGRDIILGSILYGIETLLNETGLAHHVEEILLTVLRGMGLPTDEARRIAYLPLPAIAALSTPIFAVLAPKEL